MTTLDELRLSLVTIDLQVRELEWTVLARSGTSRNSTAIVVPGRQGPQAHMYFSGTQQHAEAQAWHSQENITATAASKETYSEEGGQPPILAGAGAADAETDGI